MHPLAITNLKLQRRIENSLRDSGFAMEIPQTDIIMEGFR